MQIMIPEDHRLVVEVPESIRSGPAELIFVVSEGQIEAKPQRPNADALARWDAALAALAEDPRPFRSLTQKEKRERHRLLRGIGKGIVPSSEAVASAKQQEIELEEAKFGR